MVLAVEGDRGTEGALKRSGREGDVTRAACDAIHVTAQLPSAAAARRRKKTVI